MSLPTVRVLVDAEGVAEAAADQVIEAAERQVNSASQPPPTPSASRPIPPRACWCRLMCRRCSPSVLAEPAGREATQPSHCNIRPHRTPRIALLHPRVEV